MAQIKQEVQEKETYNYERIRALLKAEGITYAQLSELSEPAGLNYGRGYATNSIRTFLVEHRAQPDLLQFIVDQILASMRLRVNAIQLSLEKLKEDIQSVRAEFPQPVEE